MQDDLKQREQLSALADGELDSDEWAQAYRFAQQSEGREAWQMYHLVGDVLRSAELARPDRGSDFLARLHAKMAEEPVPSVMPSTLAVKPPALRQLPVQAANDALFRWKMAAGFASLAAVVAIGWNVLGSLSGGSTGPQLAVTPAAAPVQAVASNNPESQVMLRDPRLDELLAAHKQYSGTAALQMPAGFLRNANFDSPSR